MATMRTCLPVTLMSICAGPRVTAGEEAGPARNSRPRGCEDKPHASQLGCSPPPLSVASTPTQAHAREALGTPGLLCLEVSAATQRSKRWPLHPPSLSLSFSLDQAGSWSEGSPGSPSPFPFSPTNVSPNEIPARLISSWHLFLGEFTLTHGPTVKTY